MTGAISLGPESDLYQRILSLERIVRELGTNSVLDAASTGWAGQGSLRTDQDGLHLVDAAGNIVFTAATADQSLHGVTQPVNVVGGLTVSGTKSFIQPHPIKPGWVIQHAATESPQNGVEYWGTASLDATGKITVTLPGYFQPLTRQYAGQRNVQVTLQSDTPAPISATAIDSTGTFAIHGPANGAVCWHVLAVRADPDMHGQDVLAFQPEHPTT